MFSSEWGREDVYVGVRVVVTRVWLGGVSRNIKMGLRIYFCGKDP